MPGGLLSINDADVVQAIITLPGEGAWHLDVKADGPELAAGAAVTINVNNGALELAGTVRPGRGGVNAGTGWYSVVAGKAKLGAEVSARFWSFGVKLQDILDGILGDAGETRDESIAAAVLATQLDAWTQIAIPAGRALSNLVTFALGGAHKWRMTPGGRVWIGEDAWPDTDADFDVLKWRPHRNELVLGMESPTLLPGVNIPDYGRASYVEHVVNEEMVRTHVLLEAA